MTMLAPEHGAMLTGVPASAGIAHGTAVICHCGEPPLIPRRTIDAADATAEMARFDGAVTEIYAELLRQEAGVLANAGEAEAGIFAAQRQMLHDPMLRKEVSTRCAHDRLNIEAAVADATESLAAAFTRLGDPVFADRAADVRDVGRRLLSRLLAHDEPQLDQLPADTIIVARELLPSIAAKLGHIRGLVAEQGGVTAHAVILARSRGIPTLLSVDGATRRIHTGDPLIVDALAGRVLVAPTEQVRRSYRRIEAGVTKRRQTLATLTGEPAVTRDGVVIKLSANAGHLADAAAAARFRADGIALYRTEFAFLEHRQLPTEEEQYRSYCAAAEQIAPDEIVFRALDIGSDKVLPYFPLPTEANPSLGRRGTRLLLEHPEILQPQLRAILRVGATHKVALLFPMVGGVDEFRAARDAVAQARAQLELQGQEYARELPIGAMIETPSAAITVGAIASEADFLSIGSNDLVQYLLATDRFSRDMEPYYQPLHPAVLQSLKQIVDTAATAGKKVSLCGELAANPRATALLIGLGVRSFSVAPSALLEIKRAVRALDAAECGRLAGRALAAATLAEVKAVVGAGPGSPGASGRSVQ